MLLPQAPTTHDAINSPNNQSQRTGSRLAAKGLQIMNLAYRDSGVIQVCAAEDQATSPDADAKTGSSASAKLRDGNKL